MTIVMATFGARLYWDHGKVSDHDMMARVMFQAFLWMLAAHSAVILGVFSARAATSIALEKDRRTLDFLLATRLSNAEIVLGKLAACMTFVIAGFAEGMPIMLLMSPLGAIDLRVIFLAYGGLLTTAFFMIALAIWVSTGSSDARAAGGASVLLFVAWLAGPLLVAVVFPRVGLRLPGTILTANAWMLASSPLGLLLKIGAGARPSSGLMPSRGWPVCKSREGSFW